MGVLIIMISVLLGLTEWYMIRYTKLNQWFFVIALLVLAAPITLFQVPHLVSLPILLVFVAILSCAFEDWLRGYLQSKKLSKEQRSKLKDL